MSTTISTVRADGSVEIPDTYRRALGIEPDDRLALTLEDGAIQVRRVPPPPPGSDWFWVPTRNEWVQWNEIQEIVHDEIATRYVENMNSRDE
jgi:bifunctional DNA-binding transcriptional regulator/antitoxin component of YhaV-PrlF toxin-antitoxin module